MFLLVPSHPGCPGQSPESREMVCECVYVCGGRKLHTGAKSVIPNCLVISESMLHVQKLEMIMKRVKTDEGSLQKVCCCLFHFCYLFYFILFIVFF